MEVTISKQVDEIIKIETPKYFKSKYTSQICKLNETGLTKVSNHGIFYSEFDATCKYFKNNVMELLDDCTEVSKLEFEEKLSSTLLKLQVVGYE
jgi:hypothetical protein